MKKAIIEAKGNLTTAAKRLKVDRTSLYRWIDTDELKEAVQEGRDNLLDIAENVMANKIEEGDTPCLIFFLKTQGKSRGYTEKQEIALGGTDEPIKIEQKADLTKLSNEELESLLAITTKLEGSKADSSD